jgi:propanol-preferring alcohol dehydrogenase
MPSKMRAWVINRTGSVLDDRRLLDLIECEVPEPKTNEILVKVSASGVCHTELDEIEGRTPPPEFPVIPGHQVVGTVVARGTSARKFTIGERAAVGWIGWACGKCEKCRGGMENLCEGYIATGRDMDGGYAEYMVVGESFAFSIPSLFTDAEAAPLLCAGTVGYRSLKLAGLRDGQALGLTGFGASGHLVLQTARHLFPRTRFYVFARSPEERAFAAELGAAWTGEASDTPPEDLDAMIDTTPVWKSVVEALRCLAPGGRLVINAVRKEDGDKDALRALDYAGHLWREKEIKSVANVTRADAVEFLRLAAEIPLRPAVQEYPLAEAGRALDEIKRRRIRGAKVLRIG